MVHAPTSAMVPRSPLAPLYTLTAKLVTAISGPVLVERAGGSTARRLAAGGTSAGRADSGCCCAVTRCRAAAAARPMCSVV